MAAESGYTDAMLHLIEEHDNGDLIQCWTWAYLSRLVGTDLTKDTHYAIHEDGSEYDDDFGGTAYVAGRDGVGLGPLSTEKMTLPLKNVSLAEWFNSDKENGNDENIKGALHARIQARSSLAGGERPKHRGGSAHAGRGRSDAV